MNSYIRHISSNCPSPIRIRRNRRNPQWHHGYLRLYFLCPPLLSCTCRSSLWHNSRQSDDVNSYLWVCTLLGGDPSWQDVFVFPPSFLCSSACDVAFLCITLYICCHTFGSVMSHYFILIVTLYCNTNTAVTRLKIQITAHTHTHKSSKPCSGCNRMSLFQLSRHADEMLMKSSVLILLRVQNLEGR